MNDKRIKAWPIAFSIALLSSCAFRAAWDGWGYFILYPLYCIAMGIAVGEVVDAINRSRSRL